jgi:hypothetical protein
MMSVASPSYANWQFTTWGMTPSQIVTASHGAAVSVDPSTQSSIDGDRILLQMPYNTGAFDFTANFAFDNSSQLDRVHLVLQSGSATDLRAALVKKYGKPQHEDPDYEAFGGRIIWTTQDEQIVLWQMGSNTPGVTPNVSLDYSRRGDTSGNGL